MTGSEPAGFEFQRRIRVLERPEYLFEIDEHVDAAGHQFLLAHLRVFSFTPSAMKHILADWRAFRACVSAPLFAIGEEDDAKWRRFVSHLGFEPAMDVVCLNGERRRMFRSLCLNDENIIEGTTSKTKSMNGGAR